MNSDKHLLAFVKDMEYELLSMHFDLAGLDFLIRKLQHVREKLAKNESEHFHLFSEEWGDGELSVSTMGKKIGDGIPIHQLNAYG